MRADLEIDDLLASEHVILAREHRKLRDALARGVVDGRLARILPGVYADAGQATEPVIRMAAVTRWDPDAVICGHGAASLTYWPDVKVPPTLQVASPIKHQAQRGFEFCRRTVPPELVQRSGPVPVTVPALTAIDLATLDFTDPIDIALRTKQATLATLQEALQLTRKRRGNADRWSVLLDSRAEPWSHAERLAHRLYRRDGIAGWVTNRKIVLPGAGTYYLDIAFERERIAGEVDGWEYHSKPAVFESDRLRQNALVLDGWLVLRFTWKMLTTDPDYVLRTTRQALLARGRASK